MVSATLAISQWAFNNLGLHRLRITHSVADTASCRVATRAGFALEEQCAAHSSTPTAGTTNSSTLASRTTPGPGGSATPLRPGRHAVATFTACRRRKRCRRRRPGVCPGWPRCG
ncbi:GNAT family N-acetyltransferase [Streptomyces sp. NPDC056291]